MYLLKILHHCADCTRRCVLLCLCVCVYLRAVCCSGSPLGSFLEVHGEEEEAAAEEAEDKENAVVIEDIGAMQCTDTRRCKRNA